MNFHEVWPSPGSVAPRSHISSSLAKVKGQLNNDAQATQELLVALEHQGRVQAVSSSIGLFLWRIVTLGLRGLLQLRAPIVDTSDY